MFRKRDTFKNNAGDSGLLKKGENAFQLTDDGKVSS